MMLESAQPENVNVAVTDAKPLESATAEGSKVDPAIPSPDQTPKEGVDANSKGLESGQVATNSGTCTSKTSTVVSELHCVDPMVLNCRTCRPGPRMSGVASTVVCS